MSFMFRGILKLPVQPITTFSQSRPVWDAENVEVQTVIFAKVEMTKLTETFRLVSVVLVMKSSPNAPFYIPASSFEV